MTVLAGSGFEVTPDEDRAVAIREVTEAALDLV